MNIILHLFIFFAQLLSVNAHVEDDNRIYLDNRVYLNKTNIIPDTWIEIGKPSFNHFLKFGILLPQTNIHLLEQLIYDRSNPKSDNYGKWLLKNEIDNIIISDIKNFEVIDEWLHDSIQNINCNRTSDSMYCETTILDINKLFATDMLEYININTKKLFYSGRKMGYSIPKYLHKTIDIVIGIGDFPEYTHKNVKMKSIEDDVYYISPISLQKLYNISVYKHSNEHVSSQTVVEFQNDNCFNKNDLDYFLHDNGLPSVNISKKKIIGVCDMNTPAPDIEATLDIQYQLGVNVNTEEHYVSVQDWLYQYANDLYNSTNPPMVNSMSYGWSEKDQCDPMVFPECYISGDPEVYTKRTNIEFMKLSLRGITLLASSGDAGAPGRTSEECDETSPLNPVFPTSSPYVLSVGGTIIMNPTKIITTSYGVNVSPLCKTHNCIASGEELNCNFDRCSWTSGGGFSNFFNKPWWQENVSNKYLTSNVSFPPARYFNKIGRVYPDLALASHNYIIRVSGYYMAVDGTSASSPAVSGMISILNNLRLSQNKSTVGLVAPLLYDIFNNCPLCFKDIVTGSNNSTEESNCKYGYTATKGFDAVYGMGLPNFDEIYNYIKNMKN